MISPRRSATWFKVAPFRQKLMIVMLTVVTFALFLSSIGLVIVEYYNGRDAANAHNKQMGEVLASNLGAAVVFGDKDAAQAIVNSARRVSDVIYVEARSTNGTILARYLKQEDEGKGAQNGEAFRQSNSGNEIAIPIMVEKEQVGTLLVSYNHRGMDEIFISTLPVAVLIIAISLAIAFTLGNWLKNALLVPMATLTSSMRMVRQSGDLSARVETIHDPDIDEIITSYNDMLGDIEAHQSELSIAMAHLAHARDEAQAASIAKSAFLANMSHELRTPLNSIIGYTELVHEDLEAAGMSTSLEDVHWIETSSRHLLELINNLLDLSKIEAGRMDLDIHPVHIPNMLAEVEAILQPLAAKNGNKLLLNIDANLGEAMLDSTKLRQCLINLGGNASKFTDGGTITMDVRDDADRLIVAIQDTGIGMSEEEMKGLFQPFVQSDSSITRRYGGTGLGLSLVKRFVDLMGGEITATSVKGEGSLFTISIPYKRPDESSRDLAA